MKAHERLMAQRSTPVEGKPGWVKIESPVPCTVTGESYSVEVKMFDFLAWKSGKLIQEAMPYLNGDQREFLVSGMTPAEWAQL